MVKAQPSIAWHRIEYRVASAAASALADIPATELLSLLDIKEPGPDEAVEAEDGGALAASEEPMDVEVPEDQNTQVFSIFGRQARAESRASQS